MVINLIDLESWIEQLKTECPIFEGRVFETIENDNAALEFYASPLALVYVSGDNAESSASNLGINQLHHYQITVKTVVRKTVDKNDRLNACDSRLMRACRLEILNALLGWMPDDCSQPVEHLNGKLSMNGDLLLWTDNFITNDYLRRV